MRYLLLLFLFACSSTPKVHERGALIELLLRPYPDKVGFLINQRCIEFDKSGKCIKTDRKEFDLKNKEDRRQLIEMRFHCNVAGKRFGICEQYTGLCHVQPYRKSWFHKWTFPVYDYIDAEKGFNRMINANTMCASMDSYLGKNLFSDEVGL